MSALPYRLTTLIFLRDRQGRFLLIERRKSPNFGCWSPPGGKVEMSIGESPLECALRETAEETGLRVEAEQLHWFGMIAEKGFEGSGHWLMFLYNCLVEIEALPPDMDEGRFRFFSRKEIDKLKIPPSDRVILWPYYDRYHQDFFSLRASFDEQGQLQEPVLEKAYRVEVQSLNF